MTELDKFLQTIFNDLNENRAKIKMPASMKADVIETETNYIAKLDVPGFKEDEISIKIQDGNLVVKAEREDKTEENNKVVKERHTSLCRIFALNDKIDLSTIEASLDSGVLTITGNKKEKELPKTITITKKEN